MIVLSEGANLGMSVPTIGEADAYGHKKKANVAEFLGDQLAQRIAGVRFLPIDLTYFLRSGEPEVYDKHMAIYYANVIMSAVEQGMSGVMAAHRHSDFVCTDIPSKIFHLVVSIQLIIIRPAIVLASSVFLGPIFHRSDRDCVCKPAAFLVEDTR